jgi:tetratricopeptide (TPR) repeat protein
MQGLARYVLQSVCALTLAGHAGPGLADMQLYLQGRAATQRGDFREGARLFEQAVQRFREKQGERHADTLTAMSRLAVAYDWLGRSGDALALHETVLRLRTESLGERHPDTLASMHNLANSYGGIGRRTEQLPLAEKVLRLRTEVLGDQHRYTLDSMGALASAYGGMGRRTEQLALNEKLLRLRTEIRGERHPDTLASMHALAQTYAAIARHAEERDLNEKGLRLSTETLGERHPVTLIWLNNLATSYRRAGRHGESLALNEKALGLGSATMGHRHPQTLVSLANTARSLANLGRLADAAALSARYLDGIEFVRGQAGLSPENRRSLFAGFADGYRFFSAVHGSLGQLADGFRFTELGKARTLLESMVQQRASRAGVLPDAEQAELDGLNREVDALDQLIAEADSADMRRALDARRNALTRQYESLQQQLKARHPKYAQLSDVRLLAAADLPGLIPSDSMAVSYVVSGDQVAAYVLGPEGLKAYRHLGVVPHLADAVTIVRRGQSRLLPLRQVLAEEQQRAWRTSDGAYRLLQAGEPAPSGAVEATDVADVVRFLAARLLAPLSADLTGKAGWIISPDGVLAQLAFETLPFGGKSEPALAHARIHYTQSLSVYALSRSMQQHYESIGGRKSLMAMGNPQYRSGTADARKRFARADADGALALRDLDELWQPLPGTAVEVRAVAALFPDSSSVYLGKEATEQRLKALHASGDLRNFRYLLFSTHGYTLPDQPALSAIVLGLQDRTVDADGYVTAAEWPGYDLRSDLTMLSACDTGMGRLVSGEGVLGLPFALFVAGNVNTIVTLWPVDDDASAEFVRRLFERIKAGQGASVALTQTKREFLAHRRYGHPRYWAAFILVGAG